MGHKVHPLGFRLGVIKDWQGKWYADRHFAEFLQEDLKLRKLIIDRHSDAAISTIDIERQANQVTVTIRTARPGIVIGRGGQRVEETRHLLEGKIAKKVRLNIQEVHQPELDAQLVSQSIAEQMERRVAYRRAMKQSLLRTMQAGAKGIRVHCAGRLGGAEIARRLNMHDGQVPLHTLRADIDYGFTEAKTTMGRIGVKVWIYKGDILPQRKPDVVAAATVVVSAPPAASVAEAEMAAKIEEKPAVKTPKKRKTTVKKVEAAAEPVVEAAVEAEPTVAVEKKTVKKTVRKATTTTKAKKAVAEPVAEVEEKSAKTTKKKKTATKADEGKSGE
jgi:small subunit ribosomal protein S3